MPFEAYGIWKHSETLCNKRVLITRTINHGKITLALKKQENQNFNKSLSF